MAGVSENDKCTIVRKRFINASMNILLLYCYYHHHQMVERMASSMSDYGVGVDVLCMDNLHFVNNTNSKLGLFCQILLHYCETRQSGFLYKVIKRLFSKLILRSLIIRYDLIDYHMYALKYLLYMRFCVEKGIPFDITPWGSDVMRADEEALKKKRYGFEHCRYIKATENIQEVVNKKYSSFFSDKLRTVYFGNNDYETIDHVNDTYNGDVKIIREDFIPEAREKMIITCGYNGIQKQNHLRILDAIKRIGPQLKDRIFLLLPMTYGATDDYLREVEEAAKDLAVSFKLFPSRLSSQDIAKIRLVSDVVVNMQDTDAFSGSLQDHLYCKNVLIVGEWLNYVPLDNADVYYIKTSYDSLTDNITKVLTDLATYKQNCEDNYIKMKQLTSWECVLPRWADSYKS